MKIVQFMPEFGLAGAEIMCENLVYELVNLGHNVLVVSLYDYHSAITERIEKFGIEIRYLNKKSGFDLSLYRKIKLLLKSEKPDVIHTHRYLTRYVFPIAAKLNIKVVHTIHSLASKESSKFNRIVNKYYFKHHNITPIALSSKIQGTIIDEYNIPDEKVPIILNGINLSKCHVKETYEKKEKFKIVHIGRFQTEKNHIGMINAFEIVRKKHPDVELHLIGDGEGMEMIRQLVREKNLSDCVIFHGQQPNVHKFLYDMDIFTIPSLYEGISMSIAEAMGTGLPIVATEVGGTPDMLTDDCALLVPIDVKAIADAYECYYNDAKLREKHGRQALKNSVRFSSISMAKKYEEIYLRK